MNKNDNDVRYLLIAIAVIFFDRLTKLVALSLFEQPFQVNRFLSFDLAFNRGITWGLFHSEQSMLFPWVTLLTAGIIFVLSVYTIIRYMNKQSIYGELLILSGACSNLVDRVVYGAVIDFIHLSYNDWSWPIFNIADIVIVFGVIWIVFNYRDL